MGEFEFRHYPSPGQIGGNTNRDVDIPIDSPLGHRLFAFAEKTGVPFQIHYEIEDGLAYKLIHPNHSIRVYQCYLWWPGAESTRADECLVQIK